MLKLTFFFSSILLLMNCSSDTLKTYTVKKTKTPITLTGKGTDPAWANAIALTDFSYPWREEEAPRTQFQALWDEDYLYFLYRASDTDIITKTQNQGERDVVDSDRVEIFFKADDEMNPYYALEMDALARVLDTEGRYYRDVDFDWNWPAGHLQLKASRDDRGYWLEGSVSFESLRQLGMYKDDGLLKAGLYRGEYVPQEDGSNEVKWISWVMPDSETPDFHIPSSFGVLELVE